MLGSNIDLIGAIEEGVNYRRDPGERMDRGGQRGGIQYRPAKGPQLPFRGICWECNQQGHVARNCPGRADRHYQNQGTPYFPSQRFNTPPPNFQQQGRGGANQDNHRMLHPNIPVNNQSGVRPMFQMGANQQNGGMGTPAMGPNMTFPKAAGNRGDINGMRQSATTPQAPLN